MKEHIFNNQLQLIENLSAHLIDIAHEIQGSSSVMALSGGSTPKPLYDYMAPNFDWSSVWLMPTDERVVPEEDPSSNALMIKQHLLKRPSSKFISMTQNPDQIFEKNDLSLHTVLLGMGEDGHFASLFPPFIPASGESLIVEGKAPNPPMERLSLSFDVISRAQNIVLLFTGDKKKAVFDEAKERVSADLPVSYLIEACGEKLAVFLGV